MIIHRHHTVLWHSLEIVFSLSLSFSMKRQRKPSSVRFLNLFLEFPKEKQNNVERVSPLDINWFSRNSSLYSLHYYLNKEIRPCYGQPFVVMCHTKLVIEWKVHATTIEAHASSHRYLPANTMSNVSAFIHFVVAVLCCSSEFIQFSCRMNEPWSHTVEKKFNWLLLHFTSIVMLSPLTFHRSLPRSLSLPLSFDSLSIIKQTCNGIFIVWTHFRSAAITHRWVGVVWPLITNNK